MKKCIKTITLIAICTLVSILLLFQWITRPLPPQDKNIWNTKHFIAHGGGSIDGYCYTNSKEALLSSLNKGFLFVELDLYMTTDSIVVCLHNLDEFNKMTSSQLKELNSEIFVNSKLYGKYTPMTLNNAIEIWNKKPFIIVTDKLSSPTILNKYFKSNRDKVFVEAFNSDDYVELLKEGYRPMLSLTNDRIHSLMLFTLTSIKCGRLVERIVINPKTGKKLLRFYKRLGVHIASPTINNRDYVEKKVGREIDMIYTDYLAPSR